MDKAWQLVPLFGTGFLVSRMVARTGLAEEILQWFIRKSNGQFHLLLLALLMATVALSLFIPNMLTVLALLPLVSKLAEHLEGLGEEASGLVTPLMLALVYGANIGGMGSLVGSPANALMLVYLELFNVPGREQINFLSWLVWGLPLVVVFGLMAWGMLVLFLVPSGMRRFHMTLTLRVSPANVGHSKTAARLWLGTAGFWLALSFATALWPSQKALWDGLAVLFGVGFVGAVFGVPIAEAKGDRRPLLRLADCYTGLPWRGLFLAAAAVAFSGGLMLLGVPKMLAQSMQGFLPSGLSPLWLYFSFVIVTIFATELVSNTAASVAFFPIVHQLAVQFGWHPLPAIMGVALASTCAFMSPLATPATGLAFGGVKGVSLLRMLGLGFLINLLGGAWLAALLTYVLPWYYGLPVAAG